MKTLFVLFIVSAMSAISGCAQMLSVSTAEEIRRSEFRAQIVSTKSAVEVNNCMKEILRSHKNDKGRSPYAGITFRDFEKEHEITLRTSVGTPFITGVITEILFVIENFDTASGGTNSSLWVHQRLLNDGGSKGYLDRLVAVVKPCLGDAVNGSPNGPTQVKSENSTPAKGGSTTMTNSAVGVRGKDDSLNKLEQLKGLADRGVITREEFEKKKKEILDAM